VFEAPNESFRDAVFVQYNVQSTARDGGRDPELTVLLELSVRGALIRPPTSAEKRGPQGTGALQGSRLGVWLLAGVS
jgi:hypothetical protein